MEETKSVPEAILNDQTTFLAGNTTVLGRGIVAVTRPLSDTISRLIPDGLILPALRAADRAAASTVGREMHHDTADLEACRDAAIRIGREAASANAVTGGIAGLGGAATMLFDLPASLTLGMRTIQDIGASYGYEHGGHMERQFRLAILELAATSDSSERKKRIGEIEGAIRSDGGLNVHAADEASILEISVERIARTIGLTLARRQLGSSLPVMGGAIGAAVNASFQLDIATAARFAFQLRRIVSVQEPALGYR